VPCYEPSTDPEPGNATAFLSALRETVTCINVACGGSFRRLRQRHCGTRGLGERPRAVRRHSLTPPVGTHRQQPVEAAGHDRRPVPPTDFPAAVVGDRRVLAGAKHMLLAIEQRSGGWAAVFLDPLPTTRSGE
jgi:hypothetical protein